MRATGRRSATGGPVGGVRVGSRVGGWRWGLAGGPLLLLLLAACVSDRSPQAAAAAAQAGLPAGQVQSAAGTGVQQQDGKVWIANVPPAAGAGNGYVRALESILAQQGAPVPYDRLMALSGLAFITQADTEHRWEGKVDVGWWPLDAWGLGLHRGFLGQAIGFELAPAGELTLTTEQFEEMRDQRPAWYREHIRGPLEYAIRGGQPVLALTDFGTVVTGYDGTTDGVPLFGRCGCATEAVEERLSEWPCGVLVLGRRGEPLDARVADLAAVRHAVALARDEAGPFEPEWRERRFTGQRAFAAWADVLRNPAEPVEARHHANMTLRLSDSRQAAVRFLQDLASRHQGRAAWALSQAAQSYTRSLELLAQAQTDGLSASQGSRQALAELVERIAAEERTAARYLERALASL